MNNTPPAQSCNIDENLSALDHILLSEAPLAPTSGFTCSVMDSIRDEAAAQTRKFSSAIHFPWKRILPGAIPALAFLAWCTWNLSASLLIDLRASALQSTQTVTFHLTSPAITALWLLLALAASLLPFLLIRKLAGSSTLL